MSHPQIDRRAENSAGVATAFREGRVGCRGDSGCQRRFLRGDGVPEALELSDEASGLAFGVAALVEIAAEVSVQLPVVSMCHGR